MPGPAPLRLQGLRQSLPFSSCGLSPTLNPAVTPASQHSSCHSEPFRAAIRVLNVDVRENNYQEAAAGQAPGWGLECQLKKNVMHTALFSLGQGHSPLHS